MSDGIKLTVTATAGELGDWLDGETELMDEWLNGFESGVDDSRYSCNSEHGDTPWCLPWTYAPGDLIELELDEDGAIDGVTIAEAAFRYAETVRDEIISGLDDDDRDAHDEWLHDLKMDEQEAKYEG